MARNPQEVSNYALKSINAVRAKLSKPSSISNTIQTSSNPSLDSHTSSSHSDLEAV